MLSCYFFDAWRDMISALGRWPGGSVTELKDVSANQILTVVQEAQKME